MSRARQSTEPVPRQTWSRVVGLGLALALAWSAGLAGAVNPGQAASAAGIAAPDLAPAATAAPANHVSEPAGPIGSANFEIRWQTVSAGGADTASSGGDFQLRGSIGQHSASAKHPASGPSFSHVGGFWVLIANRGRAVADRLFRDRFE